MKLDTKELKTITLLYVEDDAVVMEQTSIVLTKLFKKVYCANDGQEGLEVFKAHSDDIDAVVTDINMPNMNGIDMLKQINEINHSIPTIVTTAHTDSKFLMDAIEINVDKYISKPTQVKELTVAIVNNVIKYRKINNLEIIAKGLVQKTSKDSDINSDLSTRLDYCQKQNNYYQAIIENLVITFQVDKNGIITQVSDKFCRFFGYGKSEIIGESINILKCQNCTQESFQKIMLKAIRSKKSVVTQLTITTNDGKSFNCDSTLTANYDENALVGSYTIYLDII